MRSELPTLRRPGGDASAVLAEADGTLGELRQSENAYRVQYQDALDVVQRHDDRAAEAMRAGDEGKARAALEDRRDALERADAARRRLETLRQQIAPLDEALRTARARLQTLKVPVVPPAVTPVVAPSPTAPVAETGTVPASASPNVGAGSWHRAGAALPPNPYLNAPGTVWATASPPLPAPSASPSVDRAADAIASAGDRIAEMEARIEANEASLLLDAADQDRRLKGAIDDNYRRLEVERLRSTDEPEQDTALQRLRERMRGGPSRD